MTAKSIKLSMSTSFLSWAGQLSSSASRFDILIIMKNIFRIVTSFDFQKELIIRAVSRGNPVALLRGHEVYISAGRRIRRAGVKKLARPLDTLLIIFRFIPSPVNIQNESRIPVTIRHRVNRDAIRCAGD